VLILGYTEVVFAFMLDLLSFHARHDALSVCGAAIVVLASIASVYLGRRRGAADASPAAIRKARENSVDAEEL
jgi:drug/metabolite transporter (DMT)-like permease